MMRRKCQEEKKWESRGRRVEGGGETRVWGQLKGWVTRLMSRQVAPLQKQPSTVINTLTKRAKTCPLAGIRVPECLWPRPLPVPCWSEDTLETGGNRVFLWLCIVCERSLRWECEIGEIRIWKKASPPVQNQPPPTHTPPNTGVKHHHLHLFTLPLDLYSHVC